MKSLREIAISSGRRARAGARRRRAGAIVCAGVFAKSGPGSMISCSAATPRMRARGDTLAQEREHLGADVAIQVGVLQAFARRRAGVHQDERRAAVSADIGELGIAQAADVVDDPRAGGDRSPRDGRLVGVDRDDRAELADDPFDQRHDARDLLLRPRPAGGPSRPTRRRCRGCRRPRRAARPASCTCASKAR